MQIPPEMFGNSSTAESAYKILSREYQGVIDNELGFVIAICDIIEIGPGKIIHGSGGTFHPVKFTILTYTSVMAEVVEGEVAELVDFGAFIRLGPTDGLCHVSQITDDKLNFENVNARFISTSGRSLEVGDLVRARVIAVSAGSSRSGKLGLTMRQAFLGKIEWINEELDNIDKKALEKGSATKTESETTEEKGTAKKSTKKSAKKTTKK